MQHNRCLYVTYRLCLSACTLIIYNLEKKKKQNKNNSVQFRVTSEDYYVRTCVFIFKKYTSRYKRLNISFNVCMSVRVVYNLRKKYIIVKINIFREELIELVKRKYIR